MTRISGSLLLVLLVLAELLTHLNTAYALTPPPIDVPTLVPARMVLAERCAPYFVSIKGKLKQIKPLDQHLNCLLKFRLRDAAGNIFAKQDAVIIVGGVNAKAKAYWNSMYGPVMTNSRGIARLTVRLRKYMTHGQITALLYPGVSCLAVSCK